GRAPVGQFRPAHQLGTFGFRQRDCHSRGPRMQHANRVLTNPQDFWRITLAAEAAIFASAAALRLENFDDSQALLARAEVLMKKRLDVERDVWAAVHVPIGYGDGALLRGDRAAAARHWRAAADAAQKLGSEFSVPAVLVECAQAARSEGRLDDDAVMLAAAELSPQQEERPWTHLAGVAAAVDADLGDVASAQ
ncbi:hypothetical protein AB0C83_42830, partial [Streptomyces sp. NPDC048663]